MTIDAFQIQDILNLEIFVVIFDVERRRCRRKTGFKRRGSDEVEEGNVENVMKMAHGGGKVELVSLQSDTFDNFVGANALPIELLRRPGGGDIRGIQLNHITRLEFDTFVLGAIIASL
jgi:hypothetical protein